MIQVVFDLWGTLIKSNPLFREAKRTLFKKHFPTYTPKQCEDALEKSKVELDFMINKTGMQPARGVLMNLFYSNLVGELNLESAHDIRTLRLFDEDYQDLVKLYPPLWYSKSTQYAIYDMNEDEDINLLFVSNTLYIDGSTLRYVWRESLLVNDGEIITSAGQNVSKPNPLILDNTKTENLKLVVGDNPITDGGLAKNKGVEFFQINTNNKTIKDAHEYIKSITKG